MLKRILIGIGILITIILILGAAAYFYIKPSASFVSDFIKDNPEKTAIKLVRNDTILVERNPNKMMPLASTVKIVIAVEYAIQAANGTIDADQEIALDEVAKYYVPNSDGGMHPLWLKSVKDKIGNDKISIRELAKGMIRYSSNANTEWLCKKLGLNNINNRIDSLELSNHDDVYYIVSALFVGKEIFPNIEGKELEKNLRGLSLAQYSEVTNQVHNELSIDTSYKKNIGDFSIKIQRVWSDNLPSSTVNDYVSLMKKMNSKTYFDKATHHYLDEVMEGLMKNPANQQWLKHAGMKGGSTAFVLTKASYASDKKGNTTELAYFFDDLEILDNKRLQSSMNEFELMILTDENFRRELEKELME